MRLISIWQKLGWGGAWDTAISMDRRFGGA